MATVYDVHPSNDSYDLLYVTLEGFVRGHQDWGSLGGGAARARRDETYDISAVAVCWANDVTFAPLRAQVRIVLDVIVGWLLTNPDLGLPQTAGWLRFADFEMVQSIAAHGGAEVQVPFTVTVNAHGVR